MRDRERILSNLENLYRERFREADAQGDKEHQGQLDFEFQRDQLQLELLMDIRELLAALELGGKEESGGTSSLLDKAQAIRRLTRLR